MPWARPGMPLFLRAVLANTMSEPVLRGSLTQLLGQCFPRSDQLTDRSSLHLAHHVAAMQLDSDFTDAQVECDLLIDASPRHFAQDLTLAWRQRLETLDM